MENQKKKKTSKILISILCILILLIIVGVVGVCFVMHNKLNKINYMEIDESQIEINPEVVEQQEELEGYRTIALMGIDAREDNYGKGNRSDCIILAILNQKTKEVNLVSVYRDTYLKITGRNLDKVTHAYSYGGPELTLSTLNTNLDLDMKEFVTVNFDAVVDCVDALNGIELDITQEEAKYINDYIHEINTVTGHTTPHITTAGKQHVDGVQALAYTRIRYTEGGDYKRTERMRTVIEKMLEKAKTLNITELNKVTDIILPKIYTNIDAKEIVSILPNIATYQIKQNIGWPYKTRGATIEGVWYGPPITLESNTIQLHKEIYGQADYVPSSTVKNISNEIIQKTGYTN